MCCRRSESRKPPPFPAKPSVPAILVPGHAGPVQRFGRDRWGWRPAASVGASDDELNGLGAFIAHVADDILGPLPGERERRGSANAPGRGCAPLQKASCLASLALARGDPTLDGLVFPSALRRRVDRVMGPSGPTVGEIAARGQGKRRREHRSMPHPSRTLELLPGPRAPGATCGRRFGGRPSPNPKITQAAKR